MALQTALPASWLFREEHPDYGIDGTLEIFDGDQTTGLRCYVQLKATDLSVDKPGVRIRRKTGDYYRSLQLPVLIVLYEASRERLYARWFHEFDPYYGGLGNQEIRFPFRPEDVWSDATPPRLRRDLDVMRIMASGTLPLPIPVELIVDAEQIGPVSRSEILVGLRRRLRNYRGVLKEHSNSALWIRIDADKVVVSFRGLHSRTLHVNKLLPPIDEYTAEIIVLVATVVGAAGDHNLAVTLVSSVGGQSRLLEDLDVFSTVFRSMTLSQQRGRSLDLAEQLLLSEATRPQADILMASALVPQREGPSERVLVERHLVHRIEIERDRGDSVRLGMGHYNYGNFLRSQLRFREALRQYRLAAEAYPAYLDRNYYWKELGGLLFSKRFYRASAKCYAKAIRSGPALWQALYADALMFAGSFDASRKAFSEYLESESRPEGEWILKHWALGIILELDRPTVGRRQLEAARTLATTPLTFDVAMRAIELDPLCAQAWLHYASLAGDEIGRDDRNAALIIAALIAQQDSRLWAQAFLHACSSESADLGGWIALTAFHAVRDDFIDSIRALATEMGMPEEGLEQFLEYIREMEVVYESLRKPELFEMRISGDGDAYETIEIPLDHNGEPESAQVPKIDNG